MRKINKLTAALGFLLILGSYAFAHKSEALFEVGNEWPIIEDTKIVSDSNNDYLEIIINDPNGYEDIVSDGYVAVAIDRGEIGQAAFKEGSAEKAKFVLLLNNVLYKGKKITIKVSDGANIVEKSQTLQVQEPGMSPITGFAVREPESKIKIPNIFERIINFIKGLFKNG